MANNPLANYTETLSEFITYNPKFLEDNFKMSTEDRSKKIISMFISDWLLYEISAETESEFKLFIKSTFDKYKDYYEEMLDNYEKKYDYSVGLTRVTESSNSNNSTSDVTPNLTDTHYDLPNKQTENEYPSSKDTQTGSNHSSLAGSNNGSEKVSYNDEFIQLKNAYMSQIRSLYYEFSSRFKDCFLHIYC